jgi:ABC-type branched-subunit amino acid transport system ATPase component
MLSLTGQPGPVDECHLACGTATVLVGKNDAGRTYLLDGIDAALRDDEGWWHAASLELFVTLNEVHELGVSTA